jgi:hypothetical protein
MPARATQGALGGQPRQRVHAARRAGLRQPARDTLGAERVAAALETDRLRVRCTFCFSTALQAMRHQAARRDAACYPTRLLEDVDADGAHQGVRGRAINPDMRARRRLRAAAALAAGARCSRCGGHLKIREVCGTEAGRRDMRWGRRNLGPSQRKHVARLRACGVHVLRCACTLPQRNGPLSRTPAPWRSPRPSPRVHRRQCTV